MSIELRLTDVDPPEPEPKRTIYRDRVNLPDPVLLGMTVRYFNHDDVGLYFQITGSAAGYTFDTVNLNSGEALASGADKYENLDEFVSRAKPSVGDLPSGEMEENITLILKAYTDAGYSDLKWTFERVVTVHWINSADAAFTVDELDNFDDGTVQGWTAAYEVGDIATITLTVATDYVLSAPYSLKMTLGGETTSIFSSEERANIHKPFTTPNKDKVFAIFDIRLRGYLSADGEAYTVLKYLQALRNGTVLTFLGRASDSVNADYIPQNKWIRIIVPLPANVTTTLKLVLDGWFYNNTGSTRTQYLNIWLDDFKIISK